MSREKNTVHNKVLRDQCTGCTACAAICPTNAIEMVADQEGFKFPKVDLKKCTDCGVCLATCPVLHPGQPRTPLIVYAAKAKDDAIRMKSSSGGIFTLLAREVFKQCGVVYGAGWKKPEFIVTHQRATNEEGLSDLRGSKYVQSDLSDTFTRVKADLKEGFFVLFSGTPCQVLGLKRFLKHNYENLLCVDFICHSVASPVVFELYKQSVRNDRQIVDFTFRDKSQAWRKQYQVCVQFNDDTLIRDGFLNTFLGQGWALGWFCRHSCFKCPKGFSSCSDITLSDAWGCKNFAPSLNDTKGVSLVFLTSYTGKNFWNIFLENRSVETVAVDLQEATKQNPCAWQPRRLLDPWCFLAKKRAGMFNSFTGCWEHDVQQIKKSLDRTFYNRVLSYIHRNCISKSRVEK